MTSFSQGEWVVLQEVRRGRVWAARPMRVVRDEGDLVVLWFPRGTRWKAPTSNPDRVWKDHRGERLAECAAFDVAARAERDEEPFCEPWPAWRPDPAWERPELPDGWERRCH